jgi:hypothetical protein
MSRLEELKKQNPSFSVNYVDIINNLVGKPIYTEMVINLMKNALNPQESRRKSIYHELTEDYKLDKEMVEDKTLFQLLLITRLLNDTIGFTEFKTIKKFIGFYERNLITKKDLTSYKTISDLELQLSLAELKMVDKEMEKQVKKLHEDDEWLVIKPLSFLASKKYGANTKWCTTNENNPDYFLKYSRRGILIYVINKKTGNKVAAFKNLDNDYERETSFWNMIDQRIDSMESDLPYEILSIISNEFKNTNRPNWDIQTEDEKNKQLMWIEREFYGIKEKRFSIGPVIEREESLSIAPPEPMEPRGIVVDMFGQEVMEPVESINVQLSVENERISFGEDGGY